MICPAMNPNRRWPVAGLSRGMTLTMGFPALAMTNGSPFAATAGGGIEYAMDKHWLVRGDLRYTDFGKQGFPLRMV